MYQQPIREADLLAPLPGNCESACSALGMPRLSTPNKAGACRLKSPNKDKLQNKDSVKCCTGQDPTGVSGSAH
jgi:hypothetical protein